MLLDVLLRSDTFLNLIWALFLKKIRGWVKLVRKGGGRTVGAYVTNDCTCFYSKLSINSMRSMNHAECIRTQWDWQPNFIKKQKQNSLFPMQLCHQSPGCLFPMVWGTPKVSSLGKGEAMLFHWVYLHLWDLIECHQDPRTERNDCERVCGKHPFFLDVAIWDWGGERW